jgi:hypothetical protein
MALQQYLFIPLYEEVADQFRVRLWADWRRRGSGDSNRNILGTANGPAIWPRRMLHVCLSVLGLGSILPVVRQKFWR